MLELALSFPVLILLLLGVADFGRVFYTFVTLQNAAEAGAQYGSINTAHSSNTTAMQNIALADMTNLPGATATAQQYCQCGSGAAVSCSTTCGNGTSLRVYVKVTTQATFGTVAPYPGVPSSTALKGIAVMRVQ